MSKTVEIGYEPEFAQTVVEQIQPRDTVVTVNRFGQEQRGKAVMRNNYGWVLNMGGPHGTPGIVTAANIVAVPNRWKNRKLVGHPHIKR